MTNAATLSLVPHATATATPRFRGHTASGRKQYGHAPKVMKPAVDAALYATKQIATVDAIGHVAVFAYRPTLGTLVSLVGILGIVQLVVLLGMVLRLGPDARVFAARRVVLGTTLDRIRAKYAQAPALVYSGASSVPMILRVSASSAVGS